MRDKVNISFSVSGDKITICWVLPSSNYLWWFNHKVSCNHNTRILIFFFPKNQKMLFLLCSWKNNANKASSNLCWSLTPSIKTLFNKLAVVFFCHISVTSWAIPILCERSNPECRCWRCLNSLCTVHERTEELLSNIHSTPNMKLQLTGGTEDRNMSEIPSLSSLDCFPQRCGEVCPSDWAHSWHQGSKERLSFKHSWWTWRGSTVLRGRSPFPFCGSMGFGILLCTKGLTPHFPDPKNWINLLSLNIKW